MTTRLHLRCDGCDAEAHTKPIRKHFKSVSGRSYGFGSWGWPDIDGIVAEMGWVCSDPYTACTYCPKCWAEIAASAATPEKQVG
jgi:hypothetical protein